MSRRPRRALIIGGSMSGLFAGLCFRRLGWEVDVFERSPVPLSGRGAGIVTHPQMRQALDVLGIDSSRDFGVPIEERLVLDRAGEVLARRPCPQTTTSWNRLFEMLTRAFGTERYHLGKDFREVAETDDGVTANFADGTALAGDVLVGADGFRSRVRAHFLPTAQPLYAGYVAWRGMADEAALAAVLSPELFAGFVFALPAGEQFLGYPVAGPNNDLRPGHRSWNMVWYRPADEATELPRLLTDAGGRRHELAIPPPLIAPGVVAGMRADAERLLPPQLQGVVRLVEQPFLQPIYDLECPSLSFGRVALIGDAAFIVRPHVGAGVVKGAEDGAALAGALDEHAEVAAGLRAYEARRLAIGRQFVARGRQLGSYFRDGSISEAERADHALAGTALLDFLRSPI